jgi:hypothetical protein
MLAIYDQIQQLRAELNSGAIAPDQRAAADFELNRLTVAQTELDRRLDAALAEDPAPD